MEMLEQYKILQEKAGQNYWAKRILAEIGFAIKVSETRNEWYVQEIQEAIKRLYKKFQEDGVITDRAAKEVEEYLLPLSADIKKYKVYCTAHAHIDMNWLWGLQETATIVADTFRTMLKLMEEYPEFTYSQSQAAVYALMEEYYPELIDQIRQRVKEGRWEVTACNWVELDKNMPSGEAMTRQLLYAKRYLSTLLDIKEDDIQVDFEPDTFGHSCNVPEILNNAGVKYYYHCRGFDGHYAYNWKSPSGASVLVWREPAWYNSQIDYDMLLNVPEFCAEYGIDVMMKVYGVGDHGGGPTRRDLERILDMAQWPLQPTILFGTYQQFYRELERFKDKLPDVDTELNYLLTGCYTSQSRIKRENRLAEGRLYDAEVLASLMNLGLQDPNDYRKSFEKAWRKVLFNQFHDILPGSGKIETREYAMGTYQEALAYADANANRVMHLLTDAIDTSRISTEGDRKESISEGAGVGYNVSFAQPDTTFQKRLNHNSESKYRFPETERGFGKVRIHHIFNTTQYARKEIAELTIWDWKVDPERIQAEDARGNMLPCEVMDTGIHYWGHEFIKLVVLVEVPAMGYTTCVLSEKRMEHLPVCKRKEITVDHISDKNLVLENEKIRVVFAADTMKILSFFDKENGQENVDAKRAAGVFQYVLENDESGMTAWRVGKTSLYVDLNASCPVNVRDVKTEGIRQWIRYEIPFEHSRLLVIVQLDKEEKMIRYLVNVDWKEIGEKDKGIPQLCFKVPVCCTCSAYERDVPYGVLKTQELFHDIPANSFISTVSEQTKGSVLLVTDSKYGYRGCDNSLQVDLIRSSYDPDEYPEIGQHRIEIGLALCGDDPEEKIMTAALFCHPLYTASNTSHNGTLPLYNSKITMKGKGIISSVKRTEECMDELLIRCYNPSSTPEIVELETERELKDACLTDALEHRIGKVDEIRQKKVKIRLMPNRVINIKLSFEEG
ncbi:MAG: glycoside hydrolase family 38 C-terminal domain-containing protein [Oliverpabstia sp.]